MNDTSRRYRSIKQALLQCYQPQPTGHREQHLNPLVAMICELIGGKHAHLPTIADHTSCHRATQESLITRFRAFFSTRPRPWTVGFCPWPRRCW